MILVEFFDDFDRKKLALLEKDESFLERSCRESREQIISEIGELLPSKFRFIVWGSPLSLVQESTYSIRKCAIEISEKSDYPDNVSVYRVYLRAMKSEVLPETVPVSTCTITGSEFPRRLCASGHPTLLIFNFVGYFIGIHRESRGLQLTSATSLYNKQRKHKRIV